MICKKKWKKKKRESSRTSSSSSTSSICSSSSLYDILRESESIDFEVYVQCCDSSPGYSISSCSSVDSLCQNSATEEDHLQRQDQNKKKNREASKKSRSKHKAETEKLFLKEKKLEQQNTELRIRYKILNEDMDKFLKDVVKPYIMEKLKLDADIQTLKNRVIRFSDFIQQELDQSTVERIVKMLLSERNKNEELPGIFSNIDFLFFCFFMEKQYV